MKEVNYLTPVEPFTSVFNQVVQYNDILDNEFIGALAEEVNTDMAYTLMNNAGKKRAFLPMHNIESGMSVVDRKTGFNMEGVSKNIYARGEEIDDLLLVTERANKGKAAGRLAAIFRDKIKIVGDPDYMDCLKENPIYSSVYDSSMITFPTPMYQTGIDPETKKPIYQKDEQKYEQMLNKYGFLKLVEDNQKFMSEVTMPYVKAKKNGTLTKKQAEEYKTKYMAHLQTMKETCQTISNIDFEDPLVKGSNAVVANGAIDIRWKNEFRVMGEKIDTLQSSFGNGWPTRDFGIMFEIKRWHDKLVDTAKSNESSLEEKQKAQNALDEMKTSYEALYSTKVDSLDVRNKLLTDIKAHVDKTAGKDSVLSFMIGNSLEDKVMEAEMGIITVKKNVEYNDFVDINDVYSINNPEVENKNLTDLKDNANPEVKEPEIQAPQAEKTALEKFSTTDMKKQVDELYKAMKGVDYFMFGKSSEEFNKMMESVAEMKKQMDRMAEYGKAPKLNALAVFGDLVEKSRDNVINYLNKKQVDFEEDATRRDSEKKQGREQNRIQNAIESFDKLTKIKEATKKTIEDHFIPDIQKDIKQELGKEETLRANTNITLNGYKASLTRSFNLVGMEDGRVFRKPDNDSFQKYVEKMESFKLPKYTDKQASRLYKQSPELQNLVKKVVPGKELPKDDQGGLDKTSTAELRGHYKEAVKNKAKVYKTNVNMNNYREKLLSNQRKQNMAEKQVPKA